MQKLAGVNWAPYRYKDSKWQAFPLEQYWDELKDRYTKAFSQEYSTEEKPDELRGGAVVMGQLYYLSLYGGASNTVQIGADIMSAKYQAYDKPLGASIAKGTGLAVLWLVNNVLVVNNAFFSRTQFLRTLQQLMSKEKFFGSQASVLSSQGVIAKGAKYLFTKFRSWGWAKGLSVGLLGAVLLAGVVIAVVFLVKYYMAGNKVATVFATAIAGALLTYLMVIGPILQMINVSRGLASMYHLTRTAALARTITMSS